MSLEGWQSVTNDYSKTIVTLSTAFLAFTVTFWQNVLPPEIHERGFWLLIAIWICLFVAIAAALYSAGYLVRLLMHGTHQNHLMWAANISYFSFGTAAVLLLALGVLSQFADPPWTEARALELAESVLKSSDPDAAGSWQLDSMHSAGNAQSMLFGDAANRRSATLTVRKLDGWRTS